jgi:hypothetical protein
MKTKSVIEEDPVVAEVRRIRADLWREGGSTVAGLLRLLEAPKVKKRRPPARKPTGSIPYPHSGGSSTP